MLLDEAKKGNINIILTKSISRFSRNTADFIEAVRQLNSVRTNVIFLEEGITFDGAAGISAGAVFGCNFKSRQIGRALRYNNIF